MNRSTSFEKPFFEIMKIFCNCRGKYNHKFMLLNDMSNFLRQIFIKSQKSNLFYPICLMPNRSKKHLWEEEDFSFFSLIKPQSIKKNYIKRRNVHGDIIKESGCYISQLVSNSTKHFTSTTTIYGSDNMKTQKLAIFPGFLKISQKVTILKGEDV
ncbi:hypothetical protein BpHYR1_005585 [Brachionus plicatilis]|uniref:Uncharacterized protein n=1 Tax=Brachionus plicatilis TaxID=10195 RepID=A0A3M7RID2_BRAPC|nr:hypothetical protein BpHYR1_005585 [Brachionus plicatilis]